MQIKFKLFTLLLLLISAQTFCQNNTATINGFVKNKLFTYAYLYDSDSKETKVCQIVDEKFKFNLEIDKELKMYSLFLGSESSILPENQIQHRIKDYSGIRTIALENMNLHITDGVKNSIIEGGELNKAIDEMQSCIKSSDYIGYFEKFPDSPVSVYFMKILTKLTKHPMIGSYIKVDSYYAKLSDRIKSSDEGKLIYASIFK